MSQLWFHSVQVKVYIVTTRHMVACVKIIYIQIVCHKYIIVVFVRIAVLMDNKIGYKYIMCLYLLLLVVV